MSILQTVQYNVKTMMGRYLCQRVSIQSRALSLPAWRRSMTILRPISVSYSLDTCIDHSIHVSLYLANRPVNVFHTCDKSVFQRSVQYIHIRQRS